MENFLKIKNGQCVNLDNIGILPYIDFYNSILKLFENEENHCVLYYSVPIDENLRFIMAVANDKTQDIKLLSHIIQVGEKKELDSLTEKIFALHIFEREIYENFGVNFIGNPWLKPVRFANNRYDKDLKINNYPFYSIESNELHEVGVGPIHAGIIEPGHFRFICNGEKVLHLEIQLGWQHRGVEQLFIDKKKLLQKNILAENIAGDTSIGHSMAFASLIESLGKFESGERLQIERTIALELERIAMHTIDISALCVDAAYQLGANVFGILRTGIINFLQSWCGNRLGKSLIRVAGSYFPLTAELREKLVDVLDKYEKQFWDMAHTAYRLPSVQNRFDHVGFVTRKQAVLLGAVGQTARMAGLERDIRMTHPFAAFSSNPIESLTLEKGDVFSRFLLRRKEIRNSITWIRNILKTFDFDDNESIQPDYNLSLEKNCFAISLTEGWRGEICHAAITDENGEIIHYKVKDPSMHNWKALELSLRNVEISDFPINNKSYNLSYCGFDL